MLVAISKRFYEFFVQLILIIVGVLSALAVDNYRETIQEHKAEKEFLINLRNSVQSDTIALKWEIQRTYNKINAITELISLSNSPKSVDNEKFGNLVTDVIMLIRPNFVTAVYEELKFTGNFKLIRNIKLKALIISYYGDNAIIQEQNDREVGYHPSYFLNEINFDELEYKTPFDQKRILSSLRSNEVVRTELLLLQKRLSS